MKQVNKEQNTNQIDSTQILIVDDHIFLTEGIALALKSVNKNYTTQLAHTLDDAISKLKKPHSISLVMLDLKMPGMMGLKTIQTIISLAHPAKVVLLSGNADPGVVQGAVKKGALGLIPKSLSMKSMMSVVDLVLSGQVFLPASEVVGQYTARPEDGKTLSQLEIDVLKLTSEGFTNKEIANCIGASEINVKMHMRNICRKLDARNRAHAVTIGIERQIV
jgi:two-component system nitrate/nitrite response regulator NarP